jgi:hypothetical protein
MTKTVVGLFDDFQSTQDVVQELVNNGFSKENISIVSSNSEGRYGENLTGEETGERSAAASGAGLGAAIGGIGGLLVGLGTFLVPGIGPILAAGPIIAALGGAGLGALTGGLVGALTEAGISGDDANIFAEAVQRGGTLVVAYVQDDAADRAADIMNRHNPVDLEERTAEWRNQNWAGEGAEVEPFAFDSTRKPHAPAADSASSDRPRRVRAYPSGTQAVEVQDPHTQERVESSEEDWRMFEARFREHYQNRYANLGSWEDYRESYRFGFAMGNRAPYSNADWESIRAELRQEWERNYQQLDWHDHEEAVRQGWKVRRAQR